MEGLEEVEYEALPPNAGLGVSVQDYFPVGMKEKLI